MAGNAYLTRMPLGFVGAVTRPRDLTIEPVALDHTKLFSTYGLPGKYVNDQFVPLRHYRQGEGYFRSPVPNHLRA